MANHPNRAKRYTVACLGWANNGLGWERDGDDDLSLMTRSEAEAFAQNRKNPETCSLVVYREDAEEAGEDPVALCDRGETKLTWI